MKRAGVFLNVMFAGLCAGLSAYPPCGDSGRAFCVAAAVGAGLMAIILAIDVAASERR